MPDTVRVASGWGAGTVERRTDQNSKFGGLLICSEGQKFQLTEVQAEKQLQLFLRIDTMFLRIRSAAWNRLWNIIANDVVEAHATEYIEPERYWANT